MRNGPKVLIALGNELKRGAASHQCKGDVARMYVNYLRQRYSMDEWNHVSNVNSFICEKNNIILIKPVTSLEKNSGLAIKNILNYLNCEDLKNVCIILPDLYRSIGKFKYKSYTKIYEKLGPDFYNILNSNIINNVLCNHFLQLCIGVSNYPNETKNAVAIALQECLSDGELKKIFKTFQLAEEYFHKKIMNGKVITTNYIHFKEKYPAMEPQKSFRRSTASRRYILDVYRHMYK
ncbi:conserved Plasmodium protein, unknown function [Plasmodium vivax]|uniref:Uncharacterized protein n=6 Tax=Plasmodium vivax TaxID=5855 RepID=A5K1W4_PLAVS|nr:hypothetical protein, conserved [Plasmodium vivax]KMZ79485.1 hypothetical protein PVIIG_04743 [Plasmodium vivax India VII]KMZ85724.1 hypothetical protein PVBG_01234 [Plasmodium vivax Brazil I]KMZ92198.1 hypothetical protein PVMG_02186 [Plasmodium vivax Mauritania I]KMZ98562.1 hypothetical protein PVNG_04254 [Plasmodium vivax North Korean]EDL46414.1 hypothetical protein, conserved [Plasmodium vivax]|eukprot:XP_001616141.1 hypothetical protein [Plasmodium vivax Sal-1]